MGTSITGSSQAEEMADRLRDGDYDEVFLEGAYETMAQIRAFETSASELSDTGEIPGNVHLYLGQEAVATGVCNALEEDDIIGSTHRGHGHVLAKGAEIERMMAELTAKTSGLNRGRGGSMHMVDFSIGIYGTNGIVGASVPHVAGGVLSSELDGEDRVGVAFFGDGASNEGVVYETMNLASIWDLPVIFLCENNQYAVSTPSNYSVAGDRISDRAKGFGMDGRTINGQDVLTVYKEVSDAVETARETKRPQFVECETLRYSGHFSGEKKLPWLEAKPYRPDGQLEDWKETKDPIGTFRYALVESGAVSEDRLDEIEEAVDDENEAAVEFAMEGERLPAENAPNNIYADQDYSNMPAPKYR